MVTARGRRGEYAKSAERRAEILAAGLQEFAESGFRGGSIRGVAERAGLSQAGLLHHFATKTDLLEAILTRRDEDARELLGGDSEGVDVLRGLVALTEYNASTPGLVGLYAVLSAEATASDHPAHQYFQRRYREVIEVITAAFEAAQRRGEARSDFDPGSASRRMTALLDGLQVQWLLDPDSVDMVAELRAFLQPLLLVELGETTVRVAA